MKNDQILTALIGFLVPIIFLYGFFFLAGFGKDGFFSFTYFVVLSIIGWMIFLVNSSKTDFFSFELVAFFIFLLAIFYLSGVLVLVTDFFSI